MVFLCRDEALGITAENLRVSAGSLWERAKKIAPREAGRKCGPGREKRQARGREGEWRRQAAAA